MCKYVIYIIFHVDNNCSRASHNIILFTIPVSAENILCIWWFDPWILLSISRSNSRNDISKLNTWLKSLSIFFFFGCSLPNGTCRCEGFPLYDFSLNSNNSKHNPFRCFKINHVLKRFFESSLSTKLATMCDAN